MARGAALPPALPETRAEIAAEARRAADADAALFHVQDHARDETIGWSTDPARYAGIVRAIRAAVPDPAVSVTSIHSAAVPVAGILAPVLALAEDR